MQKKRKKGFGVNFFLVGIAIIFAFALVGGAIPKFSFAPAEDKNVYEVDTEDPIATSSGTSGGSSTSGNNSSTTSKNTLQLKTIKFKKCANTVTIDFLLDRSGSMGDKTPSGVEKLTRLKEAVLSMTSGLEDESIVGIQSFSGNGIRNDVDVNYYKNIKDSVKSSVSNLRAGGNTPTHDALKKSYEVLREAMPKFPKDRTFNFIFISDGAPCPGIDCPRAGKDQDPRLYSPNPADEIKALNVNVFSLGIYTANQSNTSALRELLISIASSPDNYYEAENADQVETLLKKISEKICNTKK